MTDKLDPQVIYLAAGHAKVATGGTHAHGLHEWLENIDVVDDALSWLDGHAHLVQLSMQAYRLGDIPLVVVPHELDLVATIRYINRDYAERGFSGWQDGVCLETHFNGPSPTAAGPMVIYDRGFAPSVALADIAAPILTDVIGLPCRRWTNQDNLLARGFAYGFLLETKPLALLIEMDELHNPARADIVRDNIADNVYGEALGRVLCALAGVDPVEDEETPEPKPEPPQDLATWLYVKVSGLLGEFSRFQRDYAADWAELEHRVAELEQASVVVPEYGPATTAGTAGAPFLAVPGGTGGAS